MNTLPYSSEFSNRVNNRSGKIYFLSAEIPQKMVKIGFTVRNPMDRLYQLQAGCPCVLKIMLLIDGSLSDEKSLHRQFSHLRSHREWFFYEDDLREYVEEISSRIR